MSKPEREFFHGAVGYTVVRRGKLKPSAIPASARETYLENVDKVVRDVLARLDTGDRSDLADHWRMALGILEDCCATMYVIPPPSLIELIRCLHPVKRSRTAVRNEKMFDKAVEIRAESPDASITAIRKKVGAANQHTVKRMVDRPEFDRAVEIRQILKKVGVRP
jgi:hypothetical protein